MRLSELPYDVLRVIMSTLRDMMIPLLQLTLTCKILYEACMEVLVRSVLIDTPSAEVIRGFAGLMTRRPDLACLVKNLIIEEARLEDGPSDAHDSQDFYYAVGLLAVAVTRMENLQGVTLGQLDAPGYPSADVRVHDAISGCSSISSIRLSGRGENPGAWYDFIRKVKSPVSDLSITGISGNLSSNLKILRVLGKFSATLQTAHLTNPQIRDDLGNDAVVFPFTRTLVIIFGLVRTDMLLYAFPNLKNLTVRTGALSGSVQHLNMNSSRKFWKKLSLLDVDLEGYEGLLSPPCRVTHLRITDWIYSDNVLSALSVIHNLQPIFLSITALQGTIISLLQHISDAVDKVYVLNLVILSSDHSASLTQFLEGFISALSPLASVRCLKLVFGDSRMRRVRPPTGFHTWLIERLLRELGNLTRLSIDWPNAGWSEMCFCATWKLKPAGPPVREWMRTTNDSCDVDKLLRLYEDNQAGFLYALHQELKFGM